MARKVAKKSARSKQAKGALALEEVKAFETRPAKKLTLAKLKRLEGAASNQLHNRFVVDPGRNVAWVPSWVTELRMPGGKTIKRGRGKR